MSERRCGSFGVDDDLRVEWAPAALADLEAILDYLATRESPTLAESVGNDSRRALAPLH